MKYAKDTLNYIKSNILLLLFSYLIAAACVALLIDTNAYNTILGSVSEGKISGSFTEWFYFFILFNPSNVFTIIAGLAAYIVLILNLAFVQSLVDNHVRFGSRSIRSIASSFNINVVNSLIFAIFALFIHYLNGVIMAAIMKTCEVIPIAYSYIIGIVLCVLLIVFIFFVCSLFLLWLPCVEITGFKKYEALTYSYALARQRVWKIFAAFSIPVIVIVGISVAVCMTCIAAVSYIVVPLLIGLLFIYTSILCYMVYVDAEGIEREDLKKY